MPTGSIVRNLKQPPMLICTECGVSRNVELCAACSLPVCPRHRVGLGSLSDGYTCIGCVGYGFGGFTSAAATPLPGRAGRFIKDALGAWGWTALVVIIILFLLLAIALGHPPQ